MKTSSRIDSVFPTDKKKLIFICAIVISLVLLMQQEELEDTVFTLLNAQKSWRSSVPLLCRVGVAFAYVSFLVVVSTWVMYTRLDTEGIETMAAMALLAADAGEWAGDLAFDCVFHFLLFFSFFFFFFRRGSVHLSKSPVRSW